MLRCLPFALIACTVPAFAATVEFDLAYVGNAGNAPDSETGFGAVSYNYAISTTEVTNAQYTEFLNAVDRTAANTLSLYNTDMASNFGGIEATGATDGSRYVAQAGREHNPVSSVSFFDAMRFTNWLHNGQGSGDTETGAYTIGNGVDGVRTTDAKYWIPSEDEWYKAAYHDASAGMAGVYFDYATGSDSEPISDRPGDNLLAVNYRNDDRIANGFNDGYAVNGLTQFPLLTNPYTNVGDYTAAISPYGTYDQNGNVYEWNEPVIGSSLPIARGGSWFGSLTALRARRISFSGPSFEDSSFGFRIATIPEPSTVALTMATAVAGITRRRLTR